MTPEGKHVVFLFQGIGTAVTDIQKEAFAKQALYEKPGTMPPDANAIWADSLDESKLYLCPEGLGNSHWKDTQLIIMEVQQPHRAS